MQEFICGNIKLRNKHNFELSAIDSMFDTHLHLILPINDCTEDLI